MKNKRNKLQIKKNWDKGLTLSSEELLKFRKGGGTPTKDDNCTGCKEGGGTFGTDNRACQNNG